MTNPTKQHLRLAAVAITLIEALICSSSSSSSNGSSSNAS